MTSKLSHDPTQRNIYVVGLRFALATPGRSHVTNLRPKQNICVFQVSRPYLGFCPDLKHFIVDYEQNVVKFAKKWREMYWKMQFLFKIRAVAGQRSSPKSGPANKTKNFFRAKIKR